MVVQATPADLQQQKFYLVFRPSISLQLLVCNIYNSRNFIQSLDKAKNDEFYTIYNSRNFIQSLDLSYKRCRSILIYNSRNFIQSLDHLYSSFFQQYLQQQKFYLVFRLGPVVRRIPCHLQQQKFYLVFRLRSRGYHLLSTIVEILFSLQTFGRQVNQPIIYNSRNFIQSLDKTIQGYFRNYLQQQKFYLVFRPLADAVWLWIYNSRNFIQSLDRKFSFMWQENLQQQKFYLVFRPK